MKKKTDLVNTEMGNEEKKEVLPSTSSASEKKTIDFNSLLNTVAIESKNRQESLSLVVDLEKPYKGFRIEILVRHPEIMAKDENVSH